MELRLIKLSDQPDAGIYNMLQEIPPFENGFVNPMHGKPFGEFRGWLQSCKADAEQKGLLDGWKVPESTYWLYDGDRPVGYGKIRHFLTEKLRKDGGSIGYAVRPSERRKGYGTAFLHLLLVQCAELNVPESRSSTIRKDNLPSQKVAFGQFRHHRTPSRTKPVISESLADKPGRCNRLQKYLRSY